MRGHVLVYGLVGGVLIAGLEFIENRWLVVQHSSHHPDHHRLLPGDVAGPVLRLHITAFGGNGTNWLIMKNGPHLIGLFQGMFEKNMLTFNPGWDQDAHAVGGFTDVRDLQRQVKAAGITLTTEADEATTGPASFIAVDPDGNPLLVESAPVRGSA